MEGRTNWNPNLREIGRVHETKDTDELNEYVKAGWRVLMVSVYEGGPTWYCLGLPRVLREEIIGERRETTDPLQVYELLSSDNWRVLSVQEQADGSCLYTMGLPKAG